MNLSKDSAALLLELLANVTVNVGGDDFEEVALRLVAAKRELVAVIDASED